MHDDVAEVVRRLFIFPKASNQGDRVEISLAFSSILHSIDSQCIFRLGGQLSRDFPLSPTVEISVEISVILYG